MTKSQWSDHIGLPLPLPRPGGPPAPSPPALGFLMVSSTDRIRQAASEAAVRALIFTTEGSQTHASKLSAMSSLLTSTPYHVPPENPKYEKQTCKKLKSLRCILFLFTSIKIHYKRDWRNGIIITIQLAIRITLGTLNQLPTLILWNISQLKSGYKTC